ncbi:MAG: hypothetical protein B6D64_04865 [Bacteroidetes bacterium 4484_276]|nr:MAG: hypothetical protein B6D64_04865 [Bacteroidetes bacterium 4484_276]
MLDGVGQYTSIYFEGLLNSSLDGFNGELVLANNTRLAVSHQKVDPATFKKIMPQGRLFDEKTIKKTIDANDGIEIGWAPRHSLGGARIDARPCIYTLRQNQTQLRIKNLYATQLPEDSIT